MTSSQAKHATFATVVAQASPARSSHPLILKHEHARSVDYTGQREHVTYSTIKPASWAQHHPANNPLNERRSRLLELPVEIQTEVLRYLLDFEETATETLQWDPVPIQDHDDLVELHRVAPITNPLAMLHGGLRMNSRTNFHPSILSTCRQLYEVGSSVLRRCNKFVAVEGLRKPRMPDFETCDSVMLRTAISAFAVIPSWPLECFVWRQPMLRLPLPPRLNKVVEFRVIRPGRTQARYLGLVSRALLYFEAIGKERQDPAQTRNFELQVKFNNRFHGRLLAASPLSLQEVLSRDILQSVGKLLTKPVVFVNENMSEDKLDSAEKWFADKAKQWCNEPLRESFIRRLAEIAEAFDMAESFVASEQGDALCIHLKFYEAKRLIFELATDHAFRALGSEEMFSKLEHANAWASYRIASRPSVSSREEFDDFEVLWTGLHTWKTAADLRLAYPTTLKWSSSLVLRRAELGYAGGVERDEVSVSIIRAALAIASQEDVDKATDPGEATCNAETLQRGLELLDLTIPPNVTQEDFDIFVHLPRADLQRRQWSWAQLKGSNNVDEVDDVKDRELLLDKMRILRIAIDKRFGAVTKRPFDARALLQWKPPKL
ncbi:hypothetical protein H2200_003515 [Cladophialophora chaetospira]|uniref:Uncharacterized protein n=1 Tax=Cladophialophora chaetospira TaxID=386627 RepID=A0AA38XHH5_9EURO|nr:hypothetical protein H2200_003515 [Cladophialophora chaetospira]